MASIMEDLEGECSDIENDDDVYHGSSSAMMVNSLLLEEMDMAQEESSRARLETPLLASSPSGIEGQGSNSQSVLERSVNCSNPTITTNTDTVGAQWYNFISRFHHHILLVVWIIIIPMGLISFPKFIRSTDSTMRPIPGTYSENALQVYRESFGPVDGIGLMQDDPMNDGGILLLLKQDTNTQSDPSETLIDGSSDLFHWAQNFSLGIEEYVVSNLKITQDCFDRDLMAVLPSVNVTSYYSLMNEKLFGSAEKLCSIDGHFTTMQIAYSVPSCLYSSSNSKMIAHNVQLTYGNQILESVQQYVDQGVKHVAGVEVGITGMLSFRKDMSSGLSHDLHRMHFFVLPLALVLFLLALGGHPLLVTIPITCVLCAICSWSIIMVMLIRYGLQVTQFTPNVMITLTFGLSIDYSLFLLSRALSELKYSRSLVGGELVSDEELRQRVNVAMIEKIGQIIITSGITLMSTFLGLLILPVHFLRSVGLGASICIIMCMLVNLILVPAILCSDFGMWIMDLSSNYTFLNDNSFLDLVLSAKSKIRKFSKIVSIIWRKNASSRELDIGREHQGADEYTSFRDVLNESVDDSSLGFQDHFIDPTSINYHASDSMRQMGDSWFSEASMKAEIPGQELRRTSESDETCNNTFKVSSFWYKFGKFLSMPRRSGFLLLLIICIVIRVSVNIADLKTSISIQFMLPKESESLSTFSELQNLFGKGVLAPYRLLVKSISPEARVDTSDGFEMIQNVVRSLEQKLDPSSVQATFTGIAWTNHAPIPHSTFEMAKGCASLWQCPIESLRELAKLYVSSTLPDGTCTALNGVLSEDPFSDDGVKWLVTTRSKLRALEESGAIQGFEIVLEGGANIQYDAKTAVYDTFPKMLGSIILAIIFVLAFSFRSAAVPLRGLLTIALTLTSSFGFLSIATRQNCLNMIANSEISWLTPILSVNVIAGLAIDYDVFLMGSILEARLGGKNNSDSIISGVCNTGSIITAAGCIMSVSFGGLILSESPLVQEWAFALTSAVLVDTFVMRTCVVPILVAASGRLAWWPRNF